MIIGRNGVRYDFSITTPRGTLDTDTDNNAIEFKRWYVPRGVNCVAVITSDVTEGRNKGLTNIYQRKCVTLLNSWLKSSFHPGSPFPRNWLGWAHSYLKVEYVIDWVWYRKLFFVTLAPWGMVPRWFCFCNATLVTSTTQPIRQVTVPILLL